MLLHAPIEEQAARTPEAIAARLGDRSLSYGELDRRSGLLADDLRRRGAGPGSLVGLCAERSFELVIALLGVLKAGAAYLPLDPSYPPRRLAETLDDARPRVLLADAAGRGAIGGAGDPRPVHLEEAASPAPAAAAAPAGSRQPHPDELAYVIHTSGSSGRPKGVMCAHRGIDNRLRWMQRRYRLGPGDRVLHKTSIGFDVSLWELFWPLRAGAQLVLANPGEHRDPDALGETMRAGGVTIAHFVPAMLAAFVSSGQLDAVGSLRAVFCSGEALSPGLRERFFAHSGAELHNLYGPTEASVDVTHHACSPEEDGSSVPIGRAIEGVRVEVLDGRLRPVAPGAEGEICIAGVALARGYLGRPAPTAAAFVPDPRGDGSRLYRTGDRGRLLGDGEIRFSGRCDDQVKVRGVRIELGEVESAMASLPGVEGAAAALAGEGAARRLVGCFTGAGASPERLRRELAETLPEQAVPTDLVAVDSLPVLANGKADRAALAALAAAAATESDGAAPGAFETPQEAALAGIWREVLGVPAVAPGDNFFSLGGDSIRSIEVVARARAAGLRLSTSDVFAHPALRDLARRGGAAAGAGEVAASRRPFALLAPRDRALLPADVIDALPLSSLLAGLVAESIDNPRYLVYTTTLGIEGRFDRAALEAAIATVVDRHPALRSAVDVEGFGEPLQLVYRSLAVPVAEVDARALSPRAWERNLGEWLEREQRTPFDWRRPPLVRFTVHRRGEDRWQLTMSEPYLDGWSAAVVLAELLRAYRDGAAGGAALAPPPRVSNRELVVAEREAAGSPQHRAFWRERLAGAPATRLPRLEEAGEAGRQRRVPVPVPAAVSRGLTSLAKDLDVPLKSILLGAHARTMAALTGQQEVVCGLMANGRSEEPDGERAVGLFLNTLPLRLRVGEGSWADLARAAHAAEAGVLPWRRYPYARILHDCGGRHLFDSVFNFTHFRPYAEFGADPAVRVRSIEGSDQTYFPLTAQFGIDPLGGGIELVLELNDDRLADLQVEQLVDLHADALAEMARSPEARHREGPLIGPRERSARAGWKAPRDRPPDRGTRLEDLFERRADANPEGIAVFDERESLSFDRVRAGAGQLAFQLRHRRGAGQLRRVGICMERRPAVLEAVLASLRLGAAFVPLDCELPGPRLRAILADAELDATIADAQGARAVFAAAAADLTGPLIAIDGLSRNGRRLEAGEGRREPAESPAHVLYTSGSTGHPKGVVGSHRALVNRLRWMWDAYPFEAGEVCCLRGSLGFVDSVTSLLGGVLAGVPTYVLGDERQEPDAIARALGEAGVTRLTIVPALLQALLAGCGEEGRERLGGIRHWVLSGEPLSGDLVARLRRVAPGAAVLNLYGSTEVAGDATAHECRDREEGLVAAGTAIDAMRVRVVDRWGREAPCGAPGEVAVEGPGLASGYLNDPRLTAERFRPSPSGGGRREFRSGDLGRRGVGGGLEIRGRADRQLKVNGVRVEPAEVEAALALHPLVAGCGVVAPPAAAGLVAFVELSGANGAGAEPGAPRELREFLRGRLPSPMVPGKVVVETALPRTASGKIDRPALAGMAVEAGDSAGAERPHATPLEELVAAIWADELGVPEVGAGEDFFALGGDSLTAVRVLARLTKELDVGLALRDLFDHPTVGDFASRCAGRSRDSARGEAPHGL